MSTDNTLPWVLGGGAVAAAAFYLWPRDRTTNRSSADRANSGATTTTQPGSTSGNSAGASAGTAVSRSEPLPGRWVWPVGVWNNRKPAISDGFHGVRREPNSNAIIEHGGVDIMYRRQPADPWRAGSPNGTPNWIMPDQRAALAASDGVVWSAANTPRGWTVVIDHGPRKLATYYTHLSSLLVSAKQAVRAGTPIGIIGGDPLDGEHLKHLHFEVWQGGPHDRFDPQPVIEATWEYLPDPGDLAASPRRAERHPPLARWLRVRCPRDLALPPFTAPMTATPLSTRFAERSIHHDR